MQNPIMSLLTRTRGGQAVSQLGQIIGALKTVQDPQSQLQSMAQSNPTIQSAMQYVNQNGGDPKAAFYALARQRGADPEVILEQARNLMK